jgi:3-deoxy-manno-octulosonate cytidylyltransferase (CMP-KDO synthetase)
VLFRSWADEERVVNLQGDEPAMPVACLAQVAAVLGEHPEAAMATLWTPLQSIEQWRDANVVKVLADRAGRVMIFSRAAIPHQREPLDDSVNVLDLARRHLGLYAYRVGALRAWPALPASALERAESLEQLRALEAGWTVVGATAVAPVLPGIDSPADLVRARLSYDANEL